MLDSDQFREHIIRPCLDGLGRWSQQAENLLILTAAVESHLGTYVRQKGGGPALGIYQMEPATHDDIWRNYLTYKPDLAAAVRETSGIGQEQCIPARLVWDLRYSTCMARVHYLRVKYTIPGSANWQGLAQYWKDHYNTALGAGTPEKALEACRNCGVVL